MSVSPISVSSYMSKNDSAYPLRGIKAIAEELAQEKSKTVFDPQCIRKKCNWSSVRNEHKFDDVSFNPEVFLKDVPNSSPKLYALLKKIAALDARDEKKYGIHIIVYSIDPLYQFHSRILAHHTLTACFY